MTSYSTTHEGLERIVEGAHTVSELVGPARGMKLLPTVLLIGIVAAVVVVADRVYGDLISQGFTGEWLALWALASAAALVFAKSAFALSGALLRTARRIGKAWKASEENHRLHAEMARDPRLKADYVAAQMRAEYEHSL